MIMKICDKVIFKVKTKKNLKKYHFFDIISINIDVTKKCFK